MSITKAVDISHIRFRVPDLNLQKTFLTDFGMVEAQASQDRLFMRGYGPGPFLYAAEKGEPGFVGFGLWLDSVEELEKLAAADNVPVEPFDAPGGGFVARLRDPDGFIVEAIAGQHKSAPLAVPETPKWNQGGNHPRVAHPQAHPGGPSHVMRLGHVVLGVSDFTKSFDWYHERFGIIVSDAIEPKPGLRVGAFCRLDRGETPTDHHTLFLFQPAPTGFMHMAFEVVNLDDLAIGHDYLKEKNYPHHWGVGRHILGSQVFDYWLDPWGNEIEHWTDGDQYRASDPSGVATFAPLLDVQWGMKSPLPPGILDAQL